MGAACWVGPVAGRGPGVGAFLSPAEEGGGGGGVTSAVGGGPSSTRKTWAMQQVWVSGRLCAHAAP